MYNMTAQERAKSIEASFEMENLSFDNDCRERVLRVLTGELSIDEAIDMAKKQYYMFKKTNEGSRI